MENTPKEVSARLIEIADGMKEIAADILAEQYEPTKWKKLAILMTPLTMCLMNEPGTFMSNTKIEK